MEWVCRVSVRTSTSWREHKYLQHSNLNRQTQLARGSAAWPDVGLWFTDVQSTCSQDGDAPHLVLDDSEELEIIGEIDRPSQLSTL